MSTKVKHAADRPAARPALEEQTAPSKRPQPSPAKRSASHIATPRGQSKQARVVAMLQKKEGTTAAAVMKATGWQPHSVRGFLAAVVKKKLKLNLVSEAVDGKRIYRIAKSGSAR